MCLPRCLCVSQRCPDGPRGSHFVRVAGRTRAAVELEFASLSSKGTRAIWRTLEGFPYLDRALCRCVALCRCAGGFSHPPECVGPAPRSFSGSLWTRNTRS